MTTQLLRKIAEQDQQALADRYNGETKRQASRQWVVMAIKPTISEQEWAAALRACRDSGSLFRGRDEAMAQGFSMYRCPDTGMLTSRAEQSKLREAAAMGKLWTLQAAVKERCALTRAVDVVEWIVGRSTMLEVANWLGFRRLTGKPQRVVVDTRPVLPTVSTVLVAMADYYEWCDRDLSPGLGLDKPEQISSDSPSCYPRA